MFKTIFLVLVSLLLLIACQREEQPPTAEADLPPTATPFVYPPTWTPYVRPSDTPPATHTPNPAMAPFLAALSQNKAATTYRMDFDLSVTGNLTELGNSVDPNQDVSYLNMSGEFSGKARHITLKGVVGSYITGDPTRGVEEIIINGLIYVHGPVPNLGANENKWYILPGRDTSAQETIAAGDMFDVFSSTPVGQWQVAQSGNEALDGKQCDLYYGDKDALITGLAVLRSQTFVTRSELDLIPTVEQKFWICDDSYLHQMRISLEGRDRVHPTQRAAMHMVLHFFDFGAKLNITAPPNPLPASRPFFTPPPTATPQTGSD